MNHSVDKRIVGQVLEEIANEILREDLWNKALQKSGKDKEKAREFYIEYRVKAIKSQAIIAKTLAAEQATTIIQRYMSKVSSQRPAEEMAQPSRSNNMTSRGYHKKKCFKCGKVVVLEVKPCPGCQCNSFIFCR